ncbi:MAG: hypothetical protein LAO18_21595 [Acidobacteriia bacterium]|nr:hypothetical protein [Terriglobia bacterium]
MRNSRPEIQDFVRRSSFIFRATVMKLGASSVTNLPPRKNLSVVRIAKPIRTDPALGDLHGKLVTVELLNPGELKPKQAAIFFALGWIQGGGIAVREVAHLNARQEDDVEAEVARLPERHLADRLADAVLVVVAEVTDVQPTPFDIRSRNAPQWAAATLKTTEVLHGQPRHHATVLFPTSKRPTWVQSPRLAEKQRAIFLLHRPPDGTLFPEPIPTLPSELFTVLDEADVQPLSKRPLVKRLLSQESGV